MKILFSIIISFFILAFGALVFFIFISHLHQLLKKLKIEKKITVFEIIVLSRFLAIITIILILVPAIILGFSKHSIYTMACLMIYFILTYLL